MKTLFITLALLVMPVIAQERIDLSVAETKPSNTQYRRDRLIVQDDNPATPTDEGFIQILLIGQNGETNSCVYNVASSPTGTFLNNAMNKADLSTPYAGNATTGTLKQRIYHRLVVMGESTARCDRPITGTLAGVVP